MQFVFAPIWGRLSDRYGRRPVLLLSTAGAAVSYVVFALGSGLANSSTALWVILAARAFAGICGGNITVAQAYIADITPPENRSRRMGLIGWRSGWIILGPVIGGLSYKGLRRWAFTGSGRPVPAGWLPRFALLISFWPSRSWRKAANLLPNGRPATATENNGASSWPGRRWAC